jgi:hypothetical protein
MRVLAIGVVVAAIAPSVAQYVGKEQWSDIYVEMQACNAAMSYCADVSGAGIRVESSLTNKEACLAGSQFVWRQSYTSPAAFSIDVVKRVLSPESSSAVDLFAVRRSVGLPVTGNLTRTLAHDITEGSVEGYALCGDREYLFVFGRADSVYKIVTEARDVIRGSWQKSFDLAFPVPITLRTSPMVAEYLERYSQSAQEGEDKKDDEDSEQTNSCSSVGVSKVQSLDGATVPTVPRASWQHEMDQILTDPECNGPQTMQLRAVMAGKGHALDAAALESNIAAAEAIESELRAAGARWRKLAAGNNDGDDDESTQLPTVRAASARHLLFSDVTIEYARLLFDEAEVGNVLARSNNTLVWLEVDEVFVPHTLDVAMLTQAGYVRPVGRNVSAETPGETAAAEAIVTPFWARGITGELNFFCGTYLDGCFFSLSQNYKSN